MKLHMMNEIIGGKRYRTAAAIEVASNCYFDGHNWERSGRNTWLMKTKKGNFFAQHQSCWQGEDDWIEPLSKDEAMKKYEELREHDVEYEEAFGVVPEEA